MALYTFGFQISKISSQLNVLLYLNIGSSFPVFKEKKEKILLKFLWVIKFHENNIVINLVRMRSFFVFVLCAFTFLFHSDPPLIALYSPSSVRVIFTQATDSDVNLFWVHVQRHTRNNV